MDLPDHGDVEVLHGNDVYDVEEHADPAPDVIPEPAAADAETLEKNRLIEYIDQGLGLLTPKQVESLGYRAADLSIDELQAVKVELDRLVAEGGE